MQEIINSLNSLPQTDKPNFNSQLNTWFLVDRIRGEKTLPAFYQGTNSGLIAGIEHLVQNTAYTYLLEESPLLIKLNHTQLSDKLYQHIQTERSGIFIQAKEDNILAHLQHLFIMQSETQGQVFARYYDPLFWTALQLSTRDQQQNIWGELDSVYTTTPNSQTDKLSYYTWLSPNNTQAITKPIPPIKLSHYFYEVEENIRLLYFINEVAYQENIEITDEQLPHTTLNLKLLIRNGIQRGDHLQKLLKQCANDKRFGINDQVQTILQSQQAEFEKTNQLLALA